MRIGIVVNVVNSLTVAFVMNVVNCLTLLFFSSL